MSNTTPDELNYLGTFATIDDVYAAYPSGGVPGNFVIVGDIILDWNEDLMRWTERGSSAGQDSTVDGTLTVDELVINDALRTSDFRDDTQGSALRKVNGQWVLSVDDINVREGSSFRGQSSYKSMVFARSDERPDRPTGGGFGNPRPNESIWSDGIPQGEKPIWMSSRVFTSDNQPPQEDEWSLPALMSDAENFDVEFSPQSAATPPVPPSRSNLGILWFDPVRNENQAIDWSGMNWMATRTKSLATDGTAVWSDWSIMLIKGEHGEGVQTVFCVTYGSIPTISGDDYPPTGWSKSVNGLTVSEGSILWMSERRFEGGYWSDWSTPIRLNGTDGRAGEDGTDIEFIYKQMNRLPNATDTAPSNNRNEPDYVPRSEGWDDNPSGVDSSHKYEWACQRTKGPRDTQWSEWVGPFVWSAFGERGMDGDGVEYVFIRTTINVPPTISEAAVQEPEHYPAVGNMSAYGTNQIDDNTFYDDPKSVGPTWLYEWVSKRKKTNGVWGRFSDPALWATYSEGHTVDISENGYWVIDGIETDKKAVGTGVSIKGRVDVYRNAEIVGSQKSLEGYPVSLGNLEIGDCWIVDNGTDTNNQDVSGHLFICVATTGTLATMWHDLGEFKGEPGTSQYIHLAWASNVVFNGNTFVRADDFTKLPANSQSYEWIGIKINSEAIDTNLVASDYKWNYLRGMDGMDVEFVYIRTKTKDIEPTIEQVAEQTPAGQECYPDVENYEDFGANEIESEQFTDNPNGVNEDWPYEWMSKREKVNGVWGTFLSPARLWSNWAPPGEDAVSIMTDSVQFVVDADSEGKIAQPKTLTLHCWLYDGKEPVMPTLSRCTASYNGSSVLGQQNIDPNDPYITISITLPKDTALTTKDIYITMGNSDCSATANVPVIINRAGQNAQGVYKSFIFMRSETRPNKPGDDKGNYNSPVPNGWSDGIDPGTEPVWMSYRIFTSDEQAPQEAHWHDVVLMQDIPESYDVEFTDAPVDTPPGTPDNPASGVTWYDPVTDKNYIDTHSMNWMAQNTRVVTPQGPTWSGWIVNRIRGEKGNDGAGQAYVVVNIDDFPVDCDANGNILNDDTLSIEASLKWGDELCRITQATIRYNGVTSNMIVNASPNDKTAMADIDFDSGSPLSSGYVTIALTGKDTNNVEHIATRTITVSAKRQGATGATGPVLRFRGNYQSSEGYTFDDTFRDCVKHNDLYWILNTRKDNAQVIAPSTSTGNPWTSMGGDMKFFATELLLAENATIELLNSQKLIFTDANGNKTAGINEDGQGSHKTYYAATGRLRKDDNANGWTYYYDNDANNTLLWSIGPDGVIVKYATVIKMTPIYISRDPIDGMSNLNGDTRITMANRYVYCNENSTNNGKVYKSQSLGADNEPTASNQIVGPGTYATSNACMQDIDSDEWWLPAVVIGNDNRIQRHIRYVGSVN